MQNEDGRSVNVGVPDGHPAGGMANYFSRLAAHYRFFGRSPPGAPRKILISACTPGAKRVFPGGEIAFKID